MQTLLVWIHEHVGLSPLFQGKLGTSVFAIVLLWLLYVLTCKFITHRAPNTRVEYQLRKTAKYTIIFLGIFIVGRTWFEGFESVSTIIGLASAGVAIALKDPIVNLAGWGYILWQRPFNVGDRVEIGEQRGDVVDQGLLQFTLMEIRQWIDADQYTGRMVHVPNGILFHTPLNNYSDDYPYLWDEIHIRLTFESDWRKAKRIVQDVLAQHCQKMCTQAEEALKEASHKFMILSTHQIFTPHVYTRVVDNGVHIDAHYVVEYRKRRQMSTHIWEHLLSEFDKHDDITFAYPTWRVFRNDKEGTTGLDALPPQSAPA